MDGKKDSRESILSASFDDDKFFQTLTLNIQYIFSACENLAH